MPALARAGSSRRAGMMCGMTTRVLVVCTGNICRSPAVERLLAAGLTGTDVEVSSAGTRAMRGDAMSPPMAALVGAAGAVADGFVARQLTSALVRDSSLVLALTRQHRAAVVELEPAAVRRTFTLRELARLAAAVDPERLPDGTAGERLLALIPLAAAQRAAASPGDDDVVDPYGGPPSLYQRSFDELYGPTRQLVELLTR